MGNQCEACASTDNEQQNTLILNPLSNPQLIEYSLQPEDFYNERTREIATKLGPFKFDDEKFNKERR